MLSATLTEGLKTYGVGEKVRALRLRKKMGLVELGRHTAMSPALLSKIENGKVFPTLPTLLRIALVFSVGLEFFFSDDRKGRAVAIARRSDRLRFPEKPAAREIAYHFESLDFAAVEKKLNAYYAQFEAIAPEKVKTHQHAGVEFIYVVAGKLGLLIRSEENTLETGDSIYFDSTLPHGYRRIGNKPCEAVVITAP